MLCLYHPVTHFTMRIFLKKKIFYYPIIFFHDKDGCLIWDKPSCTLWYVLKQVSGPEVVPVSLGILEMRG